MKDFVKKIRAALSRARTWYWVSGIAAAVLVLGGVCATMGWYPIAFVDGHPIWAGSFYEAYQSGYAYWSDMLRLDSRQGDQMTPYIQNTIRGLAFEGAIDEYLIMRKLQNDIGAGALAEKIKSAEQESLNDPAFQQSVAQLGISDGSSLNYFVRQIAEYNLLDGDVRLENTTAPQWLLHARTQAHVVVLMPGYRWTGSGISVANATTTP